MVDANSRVFVIIAIIVIVILLALVLISALFFTGGSNGNVDPDGNPCNNLPPPSQINAVPQGLSEINISWNAIPNAVRYRVFVGSVPDFDKGNALITELTVSTQITIGGLVSGRDYFVKIETLNGCNDVGPLSAEIQTTIGFPSEFKILNRVQDSLGFGTAGGSVTTLQLELDCEGTDEFCFFTYDPSDKTIRPKANPLFCVASDPDPPNNDKLIIQGCNQAIVSKGINSIQWEYDDELGSLCHPIPFGGFACAKVDGLILPGQDLIVKNYDSTNEMKWDIVGVQP